VLLHERAHLGAARGHLGLECEVGHQRESAHVGAGKPGPERDLPRGRRRVAGHAGGLGGGRPRPAEQGPFDYVAGGAGSEATVRANREAFERRRCGRGCSPATPSATSRRGARTALAAPFLLARSGCSRSCIPRQDSASRAPRRRPACHVLSSAGRRLARGRRRELGESQRWFQLYMVGPTASWQAAWSTAPARRATARSWSRSTRSRSAGATRSPQRLPPRSLQGEGLRSSSATRSSARGSTQPPEEEVQTASLMALAAFPNLGLTWSDLAWLRERTELPVVLKGHPHGRGRPARARPRRRRDRRLQPRRPPGRRAVASLDVLVEVRDEVGTDATVLMDGGIRRGADVLKALALGAGRRPARPPLRVRDSPSAARPGVEAVNPQLAGRARPDAGALRAGPAPSGSSTGPPSA
jgi:hypothetical protein